MQPEQRRNARHGNVRQVNCRRYSARRENCLGRGCVLRRGAVPIRTEEVLPAVHRRDQNRNRARNGNCWLHTRSGGRAHQVVGGLAQGTVLVLTKVRVDMDGVEGGSEDEHECGERNQQTACASRQMSRLRTAPHPNRDYIREARSLPIPKWSSLFEWREQTPMSAPACYSASL
jgi:hypothetical protein